MTYSEKGEFTYNMLAKVQHLSVGFEHLIPVVYLTGSWHSNLIAHLTHSLLFIPNLMCIP